MGGWVEDLGQGRQGLWAREQAEWAVRVGLVSMGQGEGAQGEQSAGAPELAKLD